MRPHLVVLILLCAAAVAVAQEPYFPLKTKSNYEGLAWSEAEWYSSQLTAMKEPRLPPLAKDVSNETYRMTFLPSWGDAIAVRVQRHDQAFHLVAKRLHGQSGFVAGKLVETKEIELNAAESHALETLIAKLGFYQMPTDDEIAGNDGEEWIIEGVSGGRYHVVQRWTATYRTNERRLEPFLAFCKFLVNKSALSAPPSDGGEILLR